MSEPTSEHTTEDPYDLLIEWMQWWDAYGPAKMPKGLHVRTAVVLFTERQWVIPSIDPKDLPVDPMSIPPDDHGSDRYDYIEIEGTVDLPPGLAAWLNSYTPCGNCNANVFVKHAPVAGNLKTWPDWQVTIAHDDGCPTLTSIERQRESGEG